MGQIDEAAVLGWELVESACGGCRAAVKGTEIHVEFTRPGVITRRKVREFLEPLLAKHGFLTTRSQRGDPTSAAFIRRIGFESSWSDEQFHYFVMLQLPFGRA